LGPRNHWHNSPNDFLYAINSTLPNENFSVWCPGTYLLMFKREKMKGEKERKREKEKKRKKRRGEKRRGKERKGE
jgi:hypothetical protein